MRSSPATRVDSSHAYAPRSSCQCSSPFSLNFRLTSADYRSSDRLDTAFLCLGACAVSPRDHHPDSWLRCFVGFLEALECGHHSDWSHRKIGNWTYNGDPIGNMLQPGIQEES